MPTPAPRYPFNSRPQGWYAVCTSAELAPGQVLAVELADREFAVFRDEAGAVHALDAVCPHLGAHLGHGRVVDGQLACPFHDWRFAPDGRCTHVHGSDSIPARAEVAPAHVREIGPLVFMWLDPQDRPPAWEPPPAPEGRWTAPATRLYRFRGHPMDVFENAIDGNHLHVLHRWDNPELREPVHAEGPMFFIALRFDVDGATFGMPGLTNHVEVDAEAWGLGFMTQTFRVKDLAVDTLLYFTPTPVRDDEIELRVTLLIQELEEDPDMSAELVTLIGDAIHSTVLEDVAIFQHKRHIEKPLLVKGEKPIGQYRKWARQFFVQGPGGIYLAEPDAARATPPAEPATASPPASLRTRIIDRARQLLGRGEPPSVTEASSVASPASGALGEAPASSSAPRSRMSIRGQPKGPSRPPPARVSDLDEYVATLPDRFVPDAARGVHMTILWDLDGADAGPFHARIEDGSIHVAAGSVATPDVKVSIDAGTFLKVANGELSGVRAFSKRGSVTGDMRMLMRLGSVFPSARPGRGAAQEQL